MVNFFVTPTILPRSSSRLTSSSAIGRQNQGATPVDPNATANSANIARVQEAVNTQFVDDLKATLGGKA
ncbi:MAG: hypothetical protein ACRDRH_05120 [Pseudonocardia sp.]